MKRGIGGQGKSLNWRNPCVRRGLDLTEEGFKLRSASVDMIGDIYRDKKGDQLFNVNRDHQEN